MRRAFRFVFLSVLVVLMATGCDFLRSMAGRPTSKDIASMREEIRRRQADSIERAAAVRLQADSLQVVDSSASRDTISASAAKPEKKRYYVIMGAFSNRDNAANCAARLKELGYETEFFGFTEGRTAVGIGGTDDLTEAKAFMDQVRRQDFCPEGVWILDRKR